MDIKTLQLGIQKADAPEGTPQGLDLSWFVITSGVVDRDLEILDPNGMQVDNYLKNPVFLWDHDSNIPAIGKIEHLAKGADGKWRAGVRFADGTRYPFAGLVKYLHDDGILTAVSVRFIPKAWEDGNLETDGFLRKYTAWEILETSSVNIPSNYEALQIRGKDGATAKAVSEMFTKLFGAMIPGLAATTPAPDAAAGAPGKAGEELSKKNRATLRTIKSLLIDCEADIDSLMEKYGDDTTEGQPAEAPKGVTPDDLNTLKGEILAALAALKAPTITITTPGKDTQADQPGRSEKTAAPAPQDLKALVRDIVTERAKYLSGQV